MEQWLNHIWILSSNIDDEFSVNRLDHLRFGKDACLAMKVTVIRG
jgi:hypothetical protein